MLKQGMVFVFSLLFAGTVFSQKTDTTVVANTPQSDDDIVFIKADVPAEFPGGVEGWLKYLTANLKYPKKALRKKAQGAVKVQFVVSKDGSVSQVAALNDPGYGFAEEAIRVIRESGRWKPAMQNGYIGKYRHVQVIVFSLE